MSRIEKWLPTLYFVVGQAAWFACVISAAHAVPWIGAAFVFLLVAVHLKRVAHPGKELALLGCVLPISAIWESTMVQSGLIEYPSGMVFKGFAPYWILAVWVLFIAQFNTTYRWLKPHKAVAALLGAIAGPLSFRAGAALGAAHFPRFWPAMIGLAIGWAVLLPLVCLFAGRYDGVARRY